MDDVNTLDIHKDAGKVRVVMEIFQTFVLIFEKMGFGKDKEKRYPVKNTIIFENQIFLTDSVTSIAVSELEKIGDNTSKTFNFDWRSLARNKDLVKVEGIRVHEVDVQLIDSDKYREFLMQINKSYFFRVKVMKSAEETKISLGLPWMTEGVHLPLEMVLDVSRQINGMISV